ncbi:hypothetical protein ElyMa_006495400 [Elysia marginata]|uniref:Uncharacterized protein n=1 Tax=Elysia marginata TaxID=1093978 RepID=A0AAV4I3C4_9GAST|nr:hypothetical protein ElyMa_006495400 [Elysia marginata]
MAATETVRKMTQPLVKYTSRCPTTFMLLRGSNPPQKICVTDTSVRYGPRNMPLEIASDGEVSYSVTNLDFALTLLMAVYVYGEEAVKDTKQIALRNTTGGVDHL